MAVTIRPAAARDYPAYANLYGELGVDDPVPSKAHFARMVPTTLFAQCGADVAGCLVYQRNPPEGFVNQLIVDKHWRGEGVGARLMLHAAGIMQDAGCETWALNVKQRNVPAKKLYRGMGMQPAFETAVLRMAWADIERLRSATLSDDAIIDVTTTTELDATIEQTFDMALGWLQKLRRGGEIVPLLAMSGRELVGFAGYRPHFPCVVAFKARDEGVAASLLNVVMAHRRPLDTEPGCWRRDQVKIVIQRQSQLVEALQTHGAATSYMLDLMRGALPPAARKRTQAQTRSSVRRKAA